MVRTFITILLIFGAIFVGIFYFRPEWTAFRSLRAKAAYLEQISAELDDLTKNRDALFSTVNSLSKDDLNRLNTILPRGQDSARFLVFLGNATKENHLVLKSVDISGSSAPSNQKQGKIQPRPGGSALVQPQKEVNDLPFSLAVSGSYESFKSFLKELERNVRIIDIQDISFTAPASKNENAPMDFSLKMKTYYQ